MKYKWIVIILVLLLLIFGGAYLYKNFSKSSSITPDNSVCTSDSECSDGLRCFICGENENGVTTAKPGSIETPGKCTLGCM